jgi:5-methylcytosine-specific restriction protein B
MNTADRSLVHMDTALRRRFLFEAMMPDAQVLSAQGIEEVEGIDITKMLDVMNRRIELLYDREHALGHSFFLPLFNRQILPLLEEYFFEDWSRIRQVLGDDQKTDRTTCFVNPVHSEESIHALLSPDNARDLMTRAFVRNHMALKNPNSYRLIYEKDEA